jgi:hypothetical protein
MNEDGLDIPDFLRRKPGDRDITPPKPQRARTVRKKQKAHPFHLPRNIEPAGLVLLKQMEREKEEKKKARLAMLRELKTRKG